MRMQGLVKMSVLGLLLLVLALYVKAYDTKGNVAEAAEHGPGEVQGEAMLAVDGRRRTRGPLACATIKGDKPQLHIKLSDSFNVRFVVIYNDLTKERSSANDLRGFKVTVDGKLCYEDRTDGDMEEMISAVCTEPLPGSRVTISLDEPGRILSVCEAEVYEESCDCLEGCVTDQRECNAPCVSGDTCDRENVALGQNTTSSDLQEISGPSSVVVNGNFGTTYVTRKDTTDVTQQNCIETLRVPNNSMDAYGNIGAPWWHVDLGREVPVSAVVIYQRNPIPLWQSENVTTISVDDQPCAKYGRESHDRFDAQRERIVVQCDKVIRGRSLKIERVSDTVEPYPLQLCEVQVWACKKGWYGPACDKKCGHCADGRDACDALTGECDSGCAPGWFTPLCDQTCRVSNCRDGRCNQVTGLCDDCQGSFAPPQCQDCLSGFHGSTCSGLCGKCAGNSSCDVTLGNCTELPAKSEGDSHGGVVAGAVIGSLFGIILVVGAIVFIVIIIRRRRGSLRTQDKTKPATVSSTAKVYSKPEAAKTESFGYIDARSAARQLSNASSEKDTYDVINEGAYETIKMYENMKGDHHVYSTPAFRRQESQTSNTSSGYINMAATLKEESGGGKIITTSAAGSEQ